MEKRHGSRVPFKTEAEISIAGTAVRGEIKDLSMNGLFLVTGHKIDTGLSANVSIELSGSSTRLMINLKGTVIRQENNGISIKFDEMELDSFIHLKNILYYSDKHAKEYENLDPIREHRS